jgi:hypothetical protein
MSQRLIQPGRTAAIRIGTTEAGTVVWSLAGGDGTGDEGTNDDGKSGEDDDDSDDGDEKDDDDKDDEDDEDKPVYTQAEYDKIRRRMRAADKRAAEFEEQIRKAKVGTKAKPPVDKKTAKPAEDADDDDGERDQKTRAAEERAEKAEKRARAAVLDAALVNARSKAGIDWHDPDDVAKNLDLDDIDVDEDGTVDGKQLVRALKDLAKRKPHLVKPKTQSGSDDDQDGTSDGAQGGASAPKLNGKRKGEKTVDKSTLRRRFPALRA